MRAKRIYDLPTRLFHSFFALIFVTTFAIAKTVDDEKLLFSIHMLLGLGLACLMALRLIWGFLGNRYARFSSFPLRPGQLLGYLRGLFSPGARLWAGHNPASAWAALLMMALALGLGATGWLMTTGAKEEWEEVHEVLAHALLVVTLLHVVGVVFHAIKYRDQLPLSMVHGHKYGLAEHEEAGAEHKGAAVLLLAILLVFLAYLAQGFDSSRRELNVFGITLVLGEAEAHTVGREEN